MPNTWLLASVLPSSRSEIGTAAVIDLAGKRAPLQQIAPDHARGQRQHHVVELAAGCLGDRLGPRQRDRGAGETALRRNRLVQNRRRRNHAGDAVARLRIGDLADHVGDALEHRRNAAGEFHRALDLEHGVVEQDRSEIALAGTRQIEGLRRRRAVEGLAPELLVGIDQVGGDVARLVAALGLRNRLLDHARHRGDVVDHVGQRRTRAAVDAGVMHLGIEPDLVVLHALEDIELPERPGAVEELGMHPADDALQRGAVIRRRQAAAEDVTVDVELVVLDPGRMIDVERRLFQTRFEDRRDVQPRGDHRLEVLEEVAVVVLRQAEDRHAADMHRHLRRFQIQKRRVHRRQFLGVRHIFLPQ